MTDRTYTEDDLARAHTVFRHLDNGRTIGPDVIEVARLLARVRAEGHRAGLEEAARVGMTSR